MHWLSRWRAPNLRLHNGLPANSRLQRSEVWGYEALVRGTEGQSARDVLNQVNDENRYKFDQASRVKAIGLAGRLFPADSDARLSINFMPNAVYEPSACIRASLQAAERVGFNPGRIMFEFTEDERMSDPGHVHSIIQEYKRLGFQTALDDFGAGYAGLNLLANLQLDLIKIDMQLIRGVDRSHQRRVIISSIAAMVRALDISVIAEGGETEGELQTLRAAGISLFQGYLFARPEIESLPAVQMLLSASVDRASGPLRQEGR